MIPIWRGRMKPAGLGLLRRGLSIMPRWGLIVILASAIAVSRLLPGSWSTSAKTPSSAGLAAFGRIASVLQSPRCLNCHPRGDRPTQGDDRLVHLFNIQRGPKGMGALGMPCSTCHQQRNSSAGVPGAPGWHLAPKSMGWVGLSASELCRTLLDPTKNGRRDVGALVIHMNTDKLVLSGWTPRQHLSPPPLSQEDFQAALNVWAKAGAPCPN
jgi:hypothetical protein